VHGQTAEMKQHFVGHEVLLHDVLAVDGYHRGADKQMEVVGLMPRPARLPQAQCIGLDELPLEAQQQPPASHDTALHATAIFIRSRSGNVMSSTHASHYKHNGCASQRS